MSEPGAKRGMGGPAVVELFPGSCQKGGARSRALTTVAPTSCNSNSMWKCPLVPVGLLLSGVEAGTHGGREATAAQQRHGSPQAWD